MPEFSKRSIDRLSTCDLRLQLIFTEVIKHIDCTILCGHRSEQEQTEAYNSKKSKVQFPNSKHNNYPSYAVDVAPYPIDWNDKDRFFHLAAAVFDVAKQLGVKIRWGGDWDMDGDTTDQTFNDLPHFELTKEEIEDGRRT
jgi:peptidoglycan L-alanyl-D-glutamate endopeptidase CwlK